jgi:hypothetical protein
MFLKGKGEKSRKTKLVVMVDGVSLCMKSLCMKSGVGYDWLKYLHEKYRLPISDKDDFYII